MPRIRFINTSSATFLQEVRNRTGLSWGDLGEVCKVHRRSFSDWKSGECLMPQHVFEQLVELARIRQPKVEILDDYWHIPYASHKGALARNKLYGNPATFEGRSCGGKRTQAIIRANPALAIEKGIVVRKPIRKPPYSKMLAELVGTLLGDGGITPYQVCVTLNSKTDRQYAEYVSSLFNKLFRISISLQESKDENCITVVASSRNLVEFLLSIGLVQGNKIRQQIDIPAWIFTKPEYIKYCIRGLMDTDGCFYIDHHRIGGKQYYHSALAFTSYSPPLFDSVNKMFKTMGYHPTGKKEHRRNIFLRREKEILRYFKEIGSSNHKHLGRFANFLLTCRM